MKTKATPAPPAHSLIAPIEQPTRRGLEVMKGANLDKAGSPPVEHKTTHEPPELPAPPPTPAAPAGNAETVIPAVMPAPAPAAGSVEPPAASAPPARASEGEIASSSEAGQGSAPPAEPAPASKATANSDLPKATEDPKALARVLKSRLQAMDPEYGRVVDKVQVGFVLPRSADQRIEVMRHRFGVHKTDLMSAGVSAWIKEVEKLLGSPIPLDTSQLSALLPSTATRIMTTIVDFHDEPVCVLNILLPEKYDAKLSNMAYLLMMAEKRTSKRRIGGSACLKALDQLLSLTGPVGLPQNQTPKP